MDIKSFLDSFKTNSEQITNLSAEKTKLEADYAEQATLVETLKTDAKNASEALITAQADIKAKDETISSLNKQISDFNALIAEHESKETSAAVEAIKIVATVGVPAVPVIKVGAEEAKTSLTNEEIVTQFNSIKNLDEKQKFYTEHRKTILAGLDSNNK